MFRMMPHSWPLCLPTFDLFEGVPDALRCPRRHLDKEERLLCIQACCSHAPLCASTESGRVCEVYVDVDDSDRDADTRGALSLSTAAQVCYSHRGRAHEGPDTERPILHTARLRQCLSRSLSCSRRCFCITCARKGSITGGGEAFQVSGAVALDSLCSSGWTVATKPCAA